MPYSVSPRRFDHRVRPKPTMYWLTLKPNSFAGTRWPTSCSAIDASRTIANATMPATASKSIYPPMIPRARSRAQASAARTSSTPVTFPPSCSASTLATVSTMAGNASRPARNASTHSSLAAL